MNYKPYNIDLIRQVIMSLPAEEIWNLAKKLQPRVAKSIRNSANDYWAMVCDTDLQIQSLLLGYFSKSPLAGSYRVLSEELPDTPDAISESFSWFLVLDPLDGTASYIKQGEWGVMVGATDLNGKLIFSWVLTSDGRVYTSEYNSEKPLKSFTERIKETPLRIDVFNYEMSIPVTVQQQLKFKYGVRNNQINISTSECSAWVGRELADGRLDGFLWLPSQSGKKQYPYYDLILLKALDTQGFKINTAGDNFGRILMVAVAPTEEDVVNLMSVGQQVADSQNLMVKKFDDPLVVWRTK